MSHFEDTTPPLSDAPDGREPRRPWSEDDDNALIEAVNAVHGSQRPPANWNAIARYVEGRSNKDCRKRWFARMDRPVNKGSWSKEEDHLLEEGVKQFDLQWSRIATVVQTRNADQCAKRWTDALNPSIDHSPWRKEEDYLLFDGVTKHGRAWAQIIREHLPHRTGLAAKNRYNQLTRPVAPRRVLSASALPTRRPAAPSASPSKRASSKATATSLRETPIKREPSRSASRGQSDPVVIKQECSPPKFGMNVDDSPYPQQSFPPAPPAPTITYTSCNPTPPPDYPTTYNSYVEQSVPVSHTLRGYASSPELKWSAPPSFDSPSSYQPPAQPTSYNHAPTYQIPYNAYPVSATQSSPDSLQYPSGLAPSFATPPSATQSSPESLQYPSGLAPSFATPPSATQSSPESLQYPSGLAPSFATPHVYTSPTSWSEQSSQNLVPAHVEHPQPTQSWQGVQHASFPQPIQQTQTVAVQHPTYSQATQTVAIAQPQYIWTPASAAPPQPASWPPSSTNNIAQYHYQQQADTQQQIQADQAASSYWYPTEGVRIPYSYARGQ